MAKTVSRPMYEQLADTHWIERNRELNTNSYSNLNNALNNLNRFTDRDLGQYQNVADQYTASQWNDLNRGYQQAINQNIANERNRLGTTGATSSLYNTNTLQNSYNDLASRLASQTASKYNDLINQEYNRRASTADIYNQLFTNSGRTTQDNDITNWEIRNKNLDREWLNDVDSKNASGGAIKGTIGGAIKGGLQGFTMGGPWGALAGAALGGTGGAMGDSNIGGAALGTLGGLFGGGNADASTTWGQNQNWLSNSGIGDYSLPTGSLTDTFGKFSWQ